MSYSVEWIEPIFDRTYGDVQILETDTTNPNTKGSYNYFDLNRIENNTKYCAEYMVDHEIIRVPPSMAIKTNWTEQDIPNRDDMIRIVRNVMLLMNNSNPEIQKDFIELHEATQFTYQVANAIEYNLDLMHNQPELPIQKWLLTIENGIIQEYNKSSEFIAEDEIVHIQGVPYGEDAQYMIFTNWSGAEEDLQYVENVTSQVTTFKMVYHDSENYKVELTANFKTRFPRTLTLHGGTIYDDLGGTTRQFFAGDEIRILADTAAPGKAFYEWQGTEEGLDNLTGGVEPSTSWLTMPDCDVELTAFYINAGQHSVTVDGEIQGWYDYKDHVYLFAGSRGPKWVFAYWSGDTAYLENVTSSSLTMPDVNLRFTSHWNYVYSYNTVTMIQGTIDGTNKIEEAKEQSGHQIIAPAPPEGKTFGRWILEGVGSFADIESATTTFYIGDGNAVIDCEFVDARTVTIENEGNNGGTRSFIVGIGKKYSISTDEVLSDYMFDYWDKNGVRFSTSHYRNNIIMGDENVTYHAYYRNRNSYNLTVNNGTGSGTYKERQSVNISANSAPENTTWYRWSGNWYRIGNRYSMNTSIEMPSNDCEVTATYGNLHTLTVINGSGTGTYREGTVIKCYANQAPETYELAYWSEGEEVISYSNPMTITMGSTDRTIQANYKPIPYFNVTVINGKLADGATSGTFLRNSNPQIIMNPAPDGMQFFQWEVLTGDDNDVTQPLAENTTIRNLTHDVVVRATYYVPNPDIKYTLTVIGKDGEPKFYNNPIGEQVNIYADRPDEGWEFTKWTGDTQYVNDVYAEEAIVNMPGKDIVLEMKYNQIGSTPTYHVFLEGGKIKMPDEEDRWEIEGEFEEGTTLTIKADDPMLGWEFGRWKKADNASEDDRSEETVSNLTEAETTLQVRDFRITLSVEWRQTATKNFVIKDGNSTGTLPGTGSYHPGQPVQVYFNLQDTDLTHYKFTRWSGDDIAYLELMDGKAFDVFRAEEQAVRMPDRDIEITALYDISYLLTISGVEKGYYLEGENIEVSAEEIEGKTFLYWEGDTACVDNKYNPNIIVTMPQGSVNLTPKYGSTNERNNIGYTLTDLYDSGTIASEDITIISGEIGVGFIITDISGHIYIVTNITNNQLNIMRLTVKDTGPSNEQEVESNV